jgi:2-hydroxy-6-oxonona-2,4-dienedioate hydrolase
MSETPYPVHEVSGFCYLDEGPRDTNIPPVVLLHGMLGDLSNWTDTVRALTKRNCRVLVPVIPVYDLPVKDTSVPGLTTQVRAFTETLGVASSILIGNSLGGHIALLYALRHPQDVAAMVLSGASGIYEVAMGTSTFRRKDRNFIRERTELTFYDPTHATDELVDEMLEIVNDRPRAVRLIRVARSAEEETVADRLATLDMPVLLVWGKNDVITPPDVADEFNERLPDAELHFIDECGHAPMIEHPAQFNRLTIAFLEERLGIPELASRS